MRLSNMVSSTPSMASLGFRPRFTRRTVASRSLRALQGVVLALDGDQKGPGGAQGVDGEQLQGGGTVDEDIVVVGGQPLQGVFSRC